MFLTYVDESHSRGLYFLVALLCPDTEANSLSDALDQVILKAGRVHGKLAPETELHGYDIFQGKQAWSELSDKPRARIAVYGDALQAIAEHDVKVIISGVDLVRLKQRYGRNAEPAHSIVLSHLLERIDEYAKPRGELALIISDECDGQDDYRRDLRRYRSEGTWGYKARKITTVVDTMHFASSEASRLVQAADLIAFLHHRIESGNDKDPRAKRANARLYERIQPKIVHVRTWFP